MEPGPVLTGCDIKSLADCNATLLPCRLDSDVEVDSNFFQPSIFPENGHLCASLRGRPLQGKQLDVPNGFIGCLVRAKNEGHEDQEVLTVSKKFSNLTYWNLDSEPSKDDKIVQAMNWTNIAHSIHSMDTN